MAVDRSPLVRLRLQLSAWYVGTFAAILFALGGFLFLVIVHQTGADLEQSLRAATRELERAAETRERERGAPAGTVVDAVEELHIPDRSLYLFDGAGVPVQPPVVPSAIRNAAERAARDGAIDESVKESPGYHLELHAEPFSLTSGHRYVAVVTADRLELEDRYASVIALFGTLASSGLLLVALGGWFLARKAVRPVEASMERMRQFMADAAHELRTPVAVLQSRAEVTLQREHTGEEYEAALRLIVSETQRVGGIVKDLLTLARADAGERPLTRSATFLDDLVLDATTTVGALATTRGVQIEVEKFEEAPVVGDPVLLKQLLLIVLDNAIKFTPSGGSVRVRVGVEHGSATATIVDTGIGIAPADLPRVFDRFYRGETARERADGVGLGLSIARWVVEAHQGTIDVSSTVGHGTVVTIRLPSALQTG